MTFSAAFLDRDGTINAKAPEGEYVESPDEVRLLDGAAAAIAELNARGVPVIVVTNQRGIALGRMTEEDLALVHRRLDELLAAEGARIDAYYHCPHDKGECDCRKPGTALLERAAREHGLELARSVVIGDSESDVEAGRRVGARTIRVASNAGRSGDADAGRSAAGRRSTDAGRSADARRSTDAGRSADARRSTDAGRSADASSLLDAVRAVLA